MDCSATERECSSLKRECTGSADKVREARERRGTREEKAEKMEIGCENEKRIREGGGYDSVSEP